MSEHTLSPGQCMLLVRRWRSLWFSRCILNRGRKLAVTTATTTIRVGRRCGSSTGRIIDFSRSILYAVNALSFWGCDGR